MIPPRFRYRGSAKDRAAMARAFVAKAVYDLPTTRGLRDRLDTDVVLRRICGWGEVRGAERVGLLAPAELRTPSCHSACTKR